MKIRWHHLRFLYTALKQPLDLRIEHDELDDFDARFFIGSSKSIWLSLVGGVFLSYCCRMFW